MSAQKSISTSIIEAIEVGHIAKDVRGFKDNLPILKLKVEFKAAVGSAKFVTG